MKKILIIVTMLMPINSYAVDKCTLLVPKDCEYQNSEFSSGGADSVSYLIEYDCKKPNGSIVKYQDWKFSVAGFVGFGRYFTPTTIEFVSSDIKEKIELKCY